MAQKRSPRRLPKTYPEEVKSAYLDMASSHWRSKGASPALANEISRTMLDRAVRRRERAFKLSDKLKTGIEEANRHIMQQNASLREARRLSSYFFQALNRAKSPDSVAKTSAKYMPSLGSHGLVILRQGERWSGYFVNLKAHPKGRIVRRLELDAISREGIWTKRGLSEIAESDLHSLPPELRERVLHTKRIAIRPVGREGYFVVFDPREDAEVLHRLERRALGAQSRLSVLSGQTKTVDALKQLAVAEKLAELGTMAALYRHELGSPLDGVRRYANLMLDPRSGGLSDTHKKYAEGILEGANRSAAILEGLKAFTRGEGIKLRDIKIDEVLRRALSDHKEQLNKAGVRLELEFKETPPLVGEGIMLQQVFGNLIKNAYDAMDMPHLKTRVLTLRTSVVPKGGRDFVRIEVQDTGPGIPTGLKKRIFKPMFSTKPDKGGTGLGLSLAQRVVLDHGGDIHLKSSRRGRSGTSFYVDLPIKKRQ